MKLIYKGKFNGDTATLPKKPHPEGYVKFKEASDPAKFGLIANIAASVLVVALLVPLVLNVIAGGLEQLPEKALVLSAAAFATILFLFPHEILHAVCFKEEVYLYTNLKQGMLFVVGPEDMSKWRFIFMSMLPNIVLGIIPYIIGLAVPSLYAFGIFGAIMTGMGAGDYYNVINALTQMPKNAKTYLYEFNSYWYIPNGDDGK